MPDDDRKPDDDKVWVTVGLDTDYEQPYAYKATGPSEGDGPHSYTFEMAPELWDRYERAQTEWQAALDDVIANTPFDADANRLLDCCPQWSGYATPESVEYAVVRPRGGSGVDGAASVYFERDMVGHAGNKADAEAIVAALPETFWMHTHGRMERAKRAQFIVQERRFPDHTSACRNCGWPRNEHADRGEPYKPEQVSAGTPRE